VFELLANFSAYAVKLRGFHIFCGSQNLKAESLIEAHQLTFALAAKLTAACPYKPEVINLGGGLGIPYFAGEKRLDVATVGASLTALTEQYQAELDGIELVIELGRFLVAEAGLYACKVLDKKVSRGTTYLVCNGGLHHHLSNSGNFGQVIRKNYPVAIANRMAQKDTELVTIVGPLCTPLDIVADRMELPKAEVGDWVVVYQSGAYGATASPQDFLGHPAVAEILNVTDRATERMVLENLGKDNPELVEEIRRLMFVFEDIQKLGDKDIQSLLKNVETNQWAMALKGSSNALQEKIMKNMSSRASEILKEEMGFLGKVKLSDVEAIQQKIVDIVRGLEESGQLQRPGSDGEEEFVA